MDVSENSGTPKSSILSGFSIINHPFWGTPIFGNTHITKRLQPKKAPQSHRVTMPMTKSSVEWCSASSWYFFTASASGSWVRKKASETYPPTEVSSSQLGCWNMLWCFAGRRLEDPFPFEWASLGPFFWGRSRFFKLREGLLFQGRGGGGATGNPTFFLRNLTKPWQNDRPDRQRFREDWRSPRPLACSPKLWHPRTI